MDRVAAAAVQANSAAAAERLVVGVRGDYEHACSHRRAPLFRGPGVPQEDRERIFERFWRGRAAPSHGAGLGLAIVAEIMKAHGGNVEVNTGPHGGAVFTLVFLPALAHAPP